ncbi:MAG TPA: hypothetical protein VLM79_34895 [Kofleriaceae bacterium]|nr:hypothetical protein [Kofleriaceae bacterium]
MIPLVPATPRSIHSPGRKVSASLTVCTPDSASLVRSITSVTTGDALRGTSDRVPVTTMTSPAVAAAALGSSGAGRASPPSGLGGGGNGSPCATPATSAATEVHASWALI